MNNLNQYIQEKLKITSKTKIKTGFSDEELRNDYKEVKNAFSKSEKLPFMQKYDVNANKIEVICQKILELLRENRHHKKDYNKDDVIDFYRMNIPDTPYRKSKEYFDKEPIEFIEYLKVYFEKESLPFKRARESFRRIGRMNGISMADRHQINMYNNIVKYLEETQ